MVIYCYLIFAGIVAVNLLRRLGCYLYKKHFALTVFCITTILSVNLSAWICELDEIGGIKAFMQDLPKLEHIAHVGILIISAITLVVYFIVSPTYKPFSNWFALAIIETITVAYIEIGHFGFARFSLGASIACVAIVAYSVVESFLENRKKEKFIREQLAKDEKELELYSVKK